MCFFRTNFGSLDIYPNDTIAMGNSTSAENPRRAPQKLSKPRVGNLSASPTSHTGSHSSPSVDGARFANSYLVGSLPLPLGDGEARSKSAEAIPQLDELKFFDDDSQEDPKSPTDVSRSSSAPPQQQLLERRKSTGLSLGPSNELSRRQSIIQPLARASTIGTLSTRRSSHFDPIAYEACLLREGLSGGKVEGVSPTGSQHEIHEATEAGWAEASLQEDQFSPVHRTRSEASLFTTTRRRSMIQIPGVATRPQPKLPSQRSSQNIGKAFLFWSMKKWKKTLTTLKIFNATDALRCLRRPLARQTREQAHQCQLLSISRLVVCNLERFALPTADPSLPTALLVHP